MKTEEFTRETMRLLRSDLLEADFTLDGVERVTTVRLGHLITTTQLSSLKNAVEEGEKTVSDESNLNLFTLIRLFLLSEGVPSFAVATALKSSGLESLLKLEILSKSADQIKSQVSLNLIARTLKNETGAQFFWIFSDLDDHLRSGSAKKDHVMGVGGATFTLLNCIPTRPTKTGLDLGTGNGIVALELSKIYEKVIATDISERALGFAEMNISLNDVSNVELRLGSIFDPVADSQFDTIATNPPFVIAPVQSSGTWQYRSSGGAGDTLFKTLVADAPNHLKPGGVFVSLGNWEETVGAEATQFLQHATAESGVSSWVFERGKQTPDEYIATWMRDSGITAATATGRKLQSDWRDDFSARNVQAIAYGYVFIQKPLTKSNTLFRADPPETFPAAQPGFGDFWETALNEVSFFESLEDEEKLLLHPLRKHSVYERRTYIPGTEDIVNLEIIRGKAPQLNLPVTSIESALVGVADGELNLTQIAGALANLMNLSETYVKKEVLTATEKMMWHGMLKRHAV